MKWPNLDTIQRERALYHQRARALTHASGRSWYRIRALDDDTTEIFIYDAIDFIGVNAEDFVQDLTAIATPRINLRVNSPGGDFFDGIAIAHALVSHDAEVHTHVDGLAASIASVIALAGDQVTMAKGAFFMIHDPWVCACGNAADMQHIAGILAQLGDSLVEIYADRTGLSSDRIREMMNGETWLGDKQSVELGFADAVAGDERAAAAFDLSMFRHAPDELAAAMQGDPAPPASERELEHLLRDAGGLSRREAVAFVALGKQALGQGDPVPDELDEIARRVRDRHTLLQSWRH